MKENWWKILGALIILFTLYFGMTTPLKPGIVSVSPYQLEEGARVELKVETYNTAVDKEDETAAYLRIDSGQYISASGIEVVDRNNLILEFGLPGNVTAGEETVDASLILSTSSDGAYSLPQAVVIGKSNKTASYTINVMNSPDLIHQNNTYRFPYRPILNETIRNTFFHITLWFAMFLLLLGAVFNAVQYLRTKNKEYDHWSRSLTLVAVIFGMLGLVTGSIWARFTWGTWWTSDVKLNMSAISMLMYLAYFVLRSSTNDQDQAARLASAFSIFAFFTMIPLIFVIPRLNDSLHPGNGGNPALGGEDLDNSLRMIFYPAIIGFTLLGLWMSTLYHRYIVLEERLLAK